MVFLFVICFEGDWIENILGIVCFYNKINHSFEKLRLKSLLERFCKNVCDLWSKNDWKF